MRKINYKDYERFFTNDPVGIQIKLAVSRRSRGVCELCINKKASIPHHIKYPKNIPDTKEEHVLYLCKICNHKLHFGIKNGH